MKKTLLIGLILLFSYNVSSQDKIGVFAGINGSSLSNGFLKSGYLGSNSFSFHIGGLYEFRFTEKIAFRPKLLFSQQGDREDFDDNIKYETSYLNIPLNFKFFNKPYLLFGPQVGFLIDTKKKEIDFGDLKSLDYGLNLGVGIDIKRIFIELNLYQGFNELIAVEYKQTNPFRDIDINATNTVIQLSIGYNLEL
ncbi:porin family protein [Mariniflexile aquimaris]|uniref:Porin family protein n=1 Tax=Mariniflexile aquimaris TaxID=881009 RepID=A0ABW3BUW4_9FLAO